ncbi:nuclear transport factor 2 family protein [Sphingomonas sp. 1P06PA]|uniref:nuclear transport factor 2 family protein n=1 Tax=Sphingomonas sp. 1P06PA TaxID=554121 RepID=UPI0039A77746
MATVLDRPIDAGMLAARSAIATNLARHSRGVDRNDLDLLTSAYAPDATVAYGMFEGAARDFAGFLTGAMEGAPTTLHRTANMMILVDGDHARSESYVIAYTRTPDEHGPGQQRMIGGRYLDRHVRHDGAWRIAHRTYVMDWNMNAPSNEPARLAAALGGQREGDPSHGLFRNRSADDSQGGQRMDAVEEAITKQALHDLLVTYARGADRGDAALMQSAFHPDADVITGVLDAKAPEFARDIVAMVRANLKSCFHSVNNEYFEIEGDRAVGEAYVIAHTLSLGDAPEETLVGGRYLDRFEKRDGRWAISERRFISDWSMSRSATMETDGMYESLTTLGGWSPEDPSIGFFKD